MNFNVQFNNIWSWPILIKKKLQIWCLHFVHPYFFHTLFSRTVFLLHTCDLFDACVRVIPFSRTSAPTIIKEKTKEQVTTPLPSPRRSHTTTIATQTDSLEENVTLPDSCTSLQLNHNPSGGQSILTRLWMHKSVRTINCNAYCPVFYSFSEAAKKNTSAIIALPTRSKKQIPYIHSQLQPNVDLASTTRPCLNHVPKQNPWAHPTRSMCNHWYHCKTAGKVVL